MSTATEVFESTTNAIVAAIEAGAGEWRMPWLAEGTAFPWNPTTGKRYRGGNVLTLWAQAIDAGYPSGEWATYKAWQSIGAQVRRGEHGTGCIWWKVTTSTKDEETGENELDNGRRRFMARSFTVFNAAQLEGYTPKITVRDTPAQLETAEQFFTTIGANVEHRNEGRAYYSPSQDLIVLPPFDTFTDASAYYATRAHETTHWTGHETRRARNLANRFGSDAYAVEELIAELGAAFTCAAIGISPTPRPDHAAYLAHWLNVLRADPRALHSIASKAQQATDHLLQLAGINEHADLDEDHAAGRLASSTMSDRGAETTPTDEAGKLWINLEQLAATPPAQLPQARKLIAELRPDTPPNVEPERWQTMLDEADRVLDMIAERHGHP